MNPLSTSFDASVWNAEAVFGVAIKDNSQRCLSESTTAAPNENLKLQAVDALSAPLSITKLASVYCKKILDDSTIPGLRYCQLMCCRRESRAERLAQSWKSVRTSYAASYQVRGLDWMLSQANHVAANKGKHECLSVASSTGNLYSVTRACFALSVDVVRRLFEDGGTDNN